MKIVMPFVILLTLVFGFCQDALAYIGPGAGLSMLGAFWGLAVAILAALSFLLLWPIRKVLKKNPAPAEADAEPKQAP